LQTKLAQVRGFQGEGRLWRPSPPCATRSGAFGARGGPG